MFHLYPMEFFRTTGHLNETEYEGDVVYYRRHEDVMSFNSDHQQCELLRWKHLR
jgi:hypothetical protein